MDIFIFFSKFGTTLAKLSDIKHRNDFYFFKESVFPSPVFVGRICGWFRFIYDSSPPY